MADERTSIGLEGTEASVGKPAGATAPAPLELLARDDKWQLGAGDAVAFVPLFPTWLDTPGFWDAASIYHYAFEPLFTVALLGADGRELTLRLSSRRWTPAELTCEYRAVGGITATEIRTVQPGGVLASEWRIHTPRPVPLHLVAWTAQRANELDPDSLAWNGALAFVRTLRDATGASFRAAAELTCMGEAASWAAVLSDATPIRPTWRLTPFADQWTAFGRLASEMRLGSAQPGAVLFAAVHRALEPSAVDLTQTVAMRLSAADSAFRPLVASASADGGLPSDRRGTARVSRRSPTGTGIPTLAAASRRRWSDFFDTVPQLECSDPYIRTYYWYRWYGLFLTGHSQGVGNFQHATVCEGSADARRPAAATVASHVRELRWTSPELCRSLVRTFFAHQRDDGSLPRFIHVDRIDPEPSDDADWGRAIDALNAVAPDPAFTAEMYFRLARYADWLIRTRDPDSTGLFDGSPPDRAGQRGGRYPSLGPGPAGAPTRDRSRGVAPEPPFKSVEVTVYAYTLLRVLERFASESGQRTESARWGGAADRVRRAVRERMWSVDLAAFCEVDPRTGKSIGGRTDVGFLPFTTDLATVDHRHGLERSLLDPEKFWTPFPVPSVPADDPRFDPAGISDGVRRGSPANGRVWPPFTSAAVDLLAGLAREGADKFRDAAAHLMHRSIRMRFLDGDVDRPNAFEHYNPLTGAPSAFRGRDDEQQGWVNDLVIRYAAGVRPHPRGVRIDPLPLALERLELSGVIASGHRIAVSIDGDRYTATIDDARHRGTVGTPTDVSW